VSVTQTNVCLHIQQLRDQNFKEEIIDNTDISLRKFPYSAHSILKYSFAFLCVPVKIFGRRRSFNFLMISTLYFTTESVI
jgi:hypothetical protein